MNAELSRPTDAVRRFPLEGERGFSLIEVVIALAIFSFGLLAVVAMQSAAVKNKTFSNGISQAMREANQSVVEELLSLDIGNPNLDAGNHGPDTSADGVYATSYTVTDDQPEDGLKQVVVSTTWTDFNGNHTVSLQFTKDHTI
jgi:type IV pilus assembly protein PilV